MPTRKNAEAPDHPEPSSGPTIDGEHDLADHPALATGTLRNVGDGVRSRDPNAPTFRRPQTIRQESK